jgi:hypothetical protein
MITDDEIETAEAAVDAARTALSDAQGRLHALRLQRAREEYGIEPGLMVRDRKGRVGIVSEVKLWSTGGKPWVTAKLIKKDGTPGEREGSFYGDWEITQSQC